MIQSYPITDTDIQHYIVYTLDSDRMSFETFKLVFQYADEQTMALARLEEIITYLAPDRGSMMKIYEKRLKGLKELREMMGKGAHEERFASWLTEYTKRTITRVRDNVRTTDERMAYYEARRYVHTIRIVVDVNYVGMADYNRCQAECYTQLRDGLVKELEPTMGEAVNDFLKDVFEGHVPKDWGYCSEGMY